LRQVVLDTETTGLDVSEGHRIIEVACIELNDRARTGREFHEFVNPEREIEREALQIHGLDSEFLMTKPKFRDIAFELFNFIKGATLIIHNASFDLAFLNNEFRLAEAEYPEIESVCSIEDTLEIARQMRPGRRNSLDALANEYSVDISQRTTHGAFLDANILVNVYRALTGGQTAFEFDDNVGYGSGSTGETGQTRLSKPIDVVVLRATEEELELHERWLDFLDQQSESGSIWRKIDKSEIQKI
jgi:DNA polymerase-3 subunit epsilon